MLRKHLFLRPLKWVKELELVEGSLHGVEIDSELDAFIGRSGAHVEQLQFYESPQRTEDVT